jgi:hypothetical protein
MDQLFGLLGEIQYWHWLALGLALLIAEIMTGSSYLLWPAVAAWITGVLALLLPIGWPAQVVIFSAAAIVLTLTGRTYIRGRWLTRRDGPALNEPHDQYVGQRGTAAGAFSGGVGRVRLGDTEWRAESDEPVADGALVEVTGVHGATVRVRTVRQIAG